MEQYQIANMCLNILANHKRLPSYAYYQPDDDVSIFFNELTKKDIQKICRYLNQK